MKRRYTLYKLDGPGGNLTEAIMATDDRSEMVLEVAKLLYSGVDFESIKVEMDATIPEPEIRWDAGPEWMD